MCSGDLGFLADKAERLLVRADLMVQRQKTTAAQEQIHAARLLHVSRSRVSDPLRGRSISSALTA
jgi:predicted XRE-type DNA-binding protein